VAKSERGNAGVSPVSNFSEFRRHYDDCKDGQDAPTTQEFIVPPPWGGKYLWNFRIYLYVLSVDPQLIVYRRRGDTKICSEPYSRLNDPDEDVRKCAARCNKYVGMKHPNLGKPVGITMDDIRRTFSFIKEEFGEEKWQTFVNTLDESLRISSAFGQHVRQHISKGPPNLYSIGFYAVDIAFVSLVRWAISCKERY